MIRHTHELDIAVSHGKQVILDSAASHGFARQAVAAPNKEELLVFSANHSKSLQQLVANSKYYLKNNPDATVDLAYTLGVRREHLPFRTFLVTGDTYTEASPGVKPNVEQTLNFVFTGQGAQWVGMGKELLSHYPVALQTIQQLDNTLQQLPDRPSWSIETELLTGGSETEDGVSTKARAAKLEKAEFAQPLCTAVQIAIVDLLRSWGISPSAVVGHSSGEIAAAYAANAINQDEAIIAAFYRGLNTKLQTKRGAMAAVGLGKDGMMPFLAEGVVVACENSPESVTLSGDVEALRKVIEHIKHDLPGTFARELKVEMAYHSREYPSV